MTSPRIDRARKMVEGRHALAVVIALTSLFGTLGVLVRYTFLQNLDLRFTQEVQERDLPLLVQAMRTATWVGSPAVVPFVGALAAFLLWRRGLPRGAKLVLLSLLAVPLDALLKEFWNRARPDAELVRVAVKTAGTSFPSGHALGGTALYGVLAALVWIHVDDRRTRLAATLGFALLPLVIDASRVYLGAHWLSDVIGGTAVGLLLLIPLMRWYLKGIPQEAAHQDEAAELAHDLTGG